MRLGCIRTSVRATFAPCVLVGGRRHASAGNEVITRKVSASNVLSFGNDPIRLRTLMPAAERRTRVLNALFPRIGSKLPSNDDSTRCAIDGENIAQRAQDVAERFLLQSRTAPSSTVSVAEGCPTSWPRAWLYDAKYLTKIIDTTTAPISQAFVDRTISYCYLCNEPIASMTHAGYWDHVAKAVVLHLAVAWGRQWDAEHVLLEAAAALLPQHAVQRLAPGFSRSKWYTMNDWAKVISRPQTRAPTSTVVASPAFSDVHTKKRLAELQALLLSLSRWGVVDYCFVDVRAGANSQGERCFRSTMNALITTMLPPMSAQATTRISQKCWGRQSLEILFDVLNIANLFQRDPTTKRDVAQTKEQKSQVMRQLLFQLHCAIDMHGVSPSIVRTSNNPFTLPAPNAAILSDMCEMALHRIAHELIHLRTAMLMDDVAGSTWADLGFPTAHHAIHSSLLW